MFIIPWSKFMRNPTIIQVRKKNKSMPLSSEKTEDTEKSIKFLRLITVTVEVPKGVYLEFDKISF